MLVEKGIEFEEVNVDLGKKPQHFIDTYASIALDPEARAKAPILEVGEPGTPGYVRLIESEVVARYIEDAFPRPAMQPRDAARRAEGNMFITTFMEIVVTNYNQILIAKTQQKVDAAWVGIRRGLFAVEAGLEKYRTGTPFFADTFGIVEALTGPFVIRMLLNVEQHRGIDMLEMNDLPSAVSWMTAIRDHPSVADTSPSEKSLCVIPPFLEPFFKTVVSDEARWSKPSTSAAEEAKFAASVDAGLVHKGKSPRDRSGPASRL